MKIIIAHSKDFGHSRRMWTLENTQLPIVASPESALPPLFYVETGESLAPLSLIDVQANYTLPGTQATAAPAIVNAVTNSNNTIDVGNLAQVDAIAVGLTLYTPALNPSSPRPGEFIVTGTIAALTPISPIPPGLPVHILGGIEITATDYVDPSILQVFYGLPVVAELRWSLSAEAHPSGSISLRVIGDENCALVDRRFKKGTEVNFAGIGFSVTSYTKNLINTHDAPGRMWEISVSLGGKWEARRYQKPAFLVPSANLPAVDGAPYQDPDCQLFRTIDEFRAARPTRISVSQLAERVGVKFVGFSSASTQAEIFDRVGLKPFPKVVNIIGTTPIAPTKPLDVWSVPLPSDIPRGATGSWQETLDSLKRHNGCYVDYSSPDAIYARDIESGNRWSYRVPAIQIAYQGDTTNSPGIEGYAVEYPATRLTGEFSEPAGQNGESTQGRNDASSQWKRRSPTIKTLRSGNINASSPPANFRVIRNMSMTWDTSGPTQEEVEITTMDGIEMFKRRIVYGAVFTSLEVTEDPDAGNPIGTQGRKHGPVFGAAGSFWQVVQEETTETLFDPYTRYMLGSKTTGSRKGRYKQETDQLELLDLDGTDEESRYEASLYQFRDFPTYSIEQKLLVQFGSYYKDVWRNPPPIELVKRCNPDGTSGMVPVRDPNYVEPMFEVASLAYTNNFSHTRNPDSTEDEPLPDLTQGEERLSESAIQIIPSRATSTIVAGYVDRAKKLDTDDDQYIQYDYEISSQGSNFGEYVAKRTFAANSGRPGAAQRLPDIYEKEEPEPDSGNPNIYKNPQEAEFDYILCTPGQNPNQPSTSSISFQNASYLHQGITGAATDLKYRDIKDSVAYSAVIPTNHQIRPLDYVQLFDGETTHLTRADSIENSILLQGDLNGYPLVVSPQNTQIKAGIDRTIPFTITRRPNPRTFQIFGGVRSIGLTLGEIIPPTLQGRGNY